MSKRPLITLSTLPETTLSALTRAGFSTVEDLDSTTPELLAKDLRISLDSSQAVFTATQAPRGPSLTQSASLLAGITSVRASTLCPPLDSLLEGGLKRGSILEISGPPGACKEPLTVNLTKSILRRNQGVLFVDMQNMTNAAQLLNALSSDSTLPPDFRQLVMHMSLHTLPELVVFLHTLPSILQQHPHIELLVLNSLWFPLHSLNGINRHARSAVMAKLKDTLTKACASTALSVVATIRLRTQFINADGSAGTYDSGGRGLVAPDPSPEYLPATRSYRVMIVPRTRTTGVLRLLSNEPGVHDIPTVTREEPYEMVDGLMR